MLTFHGIWEILTLHMIRHQSGTKPILLAKILATKFGFIADWSWYLGNVNISWYLDNINISCILRIFLSNHRITEKILKMHEMLIFLK